MTKWFGFGLIALCLVPTVAAAKGTKVSQRDFTITKKIDKASPMTTSPPPAGPTAIPYPNSGGSKNKK